MSESPEGVAELNFNAGYARARAERREQAISPPLRDQFAMAALSATLPDPSDAVWIAKQAYAIADAMLEERNA